MVSSLFVLILSIITTFAFSMEVQLNQTQQRTPFSDASKAKLADYIIKKTCGQFNPLTATPIPSLLLFCGPVQHQDGQRFTALSCGNLLAKIQQTLLLYPQEKDTIISYIQYVSKEHIAITRLHISSLSSNAGSDQSLSYPLEGEELPKSDLISLAKEAWTQEEFDNHIAYVKVLIANVFLHEVFVPHFVSYDNKQIVTYPVLADTLLTKIVKEEDDESLKEYIGLLFLSSADFNQPPYHLFQSIQPDNDKPLTLALQRNNAAIAAFLYLLGAKFKECCSINGTFDRQQYKIINVLINKLSSGEPKNLLINAQNTFKQVLGNF